MDKNIKTQIFIDYLAQEGFKPEVDKDGDVTFKYEGGSYFIQVDERDDQFFRICYPNFWDIENDAERSRVLVACDQANSGMKVAKVFIVRNSVWGSIELFLPNPEAFKPIWSRCLSALRAGVKRFVTEMDQSKNS